MNDTQLTTEFAVVSNRLAQYARAMDDKDAMAASTLLADAELHFRDSPVQRGQAEIERFFAGLFGARQATHFVSNVIVASTSSVTYEALYQRWSISADVPQLEGFGRYAGRFDRTGDGLVWAEHRVLAI